MEELVTVALVGTAKHPQGGRVACDAADELLAPWQDETPEGRLLLQAGVEAAREQAGYEPPTLPPPPSPAALDNAPAGSPRLVGILQNALAADEKAVLIEFAGLLRSSGLLVPPELLPAVLDSQDTDLREALLPLLGERGRWLSQFRESWSWATLGAGGLSSDGLDSLKRQWEEGNIATRTAVLARVRKTDAALARTWLQAIFKQEKPEHRLRLLEQLSNSLEGSDEPFLDEALADRSENVRRAAAILLAKLPGSQLATRTRERADAIMQGTPAHPGKPLSIACTPPTEIDAAWKRDGVPEQAQGGRGKRAMWVEAVLRAVPPGHWTARFAAEPAALIEAIRDDDFAPAVIEGWTQAAIAFLIEKKTAAWLAPLWDYWLPLAAKSPAGKTVPARAHVADLLRAMPAAVAEACVASQMSAGDSSELHAADLADILPRPWSAGFAANFMERAIGAIGERSDNVGYRWACSLARAGRALPPSCFPEALQRAEQALQGPKSGHYTEREVDKFIEIIRLRETFYREIA